MRIKHIEEGSEVRRLPSGFSVVCLCLAIASIVALVSANADSLGGLGIQADVGEGPGLGSQSADLAPDMEELQSPSSRFLAGDIQTVPAIVEEVLTTSGFEGPGPNLPPFLSDVLVHDNMSTELHPRIAVDDTTGVYWTAFSHNNGVDDDLYVAYSLDSGSTWSMHVSLSNAWNESKPAISASDGTIVVFYEHDESGSEQRMRYIRSNDSGLNWAASYVDWTFTNDPGWEKQEDFDNLDVSSTRPDWWHVAADSYHPDEDLRRICFAWSDDDATSWTMRVYILSTWRPNQDLYRPVIMENTVDNYVHMAFERWNITEAGYDIVWWVLDHSLSVHEAWTSGNWDGGNTNMYPDIWVRGDEAYLVWQNGTVNPDLAGFYSDDGGDTNPTRLHITSQNGFAERYPAVYVDESNVPHISCLNETSIMYMNNTDVINLPWQYTKADDAPGNVVDTPRATDVLYYAGSPRIMWNDNRRGNSDIFFTALGTNTVQYTITKDPLSGIGDLIVDSVPCTAPCVFNWQVGGNHSMEAPATMVDPGTPDEKRYAFSSWSDGGARVHNITVGLVAETITAYYDTEYNVTIATDPSGLNVTIDGSPYVAPYVFWWLGSSIHVIEADSPQSKDPWTRYAWISWSDGGPRSHVIMVPGATTYTAYYSSECMVNVTTSPVGLDVIVDGSFYISPLSFWWLNGSVHSVEAIPFIQVSSDEAFVFSFWSDGGARAHDVTVSCPMSTLIAYYNTAWNVSFETSPTGLDVEVDGLVFDTSSPTYFFFGHMSNHTIGAPSPQPIDATSQYAWESWSDGGSQVHDINVTGPVTHRAYFNKQYLITVENLGLFLNITVDSVEHTTPYSFWCDEGSSFTLGTLSPYQISPTERLIFYAWSDGFNTYPEPVTTQPCTGPATYMQMFNSEYLVNITTDPEGLDVEIDGIVYVGPQEMWFEIGEVHEIGAPSPQLSGDTRAVFSHWNDGGPQYHIVTIVAPATFVAYFDTQYLVTITSSPVTGLDIEVDGVPKTTDYVFWCDAGSLHSINALSPQVGGAPGSRWIWTNWSDGLAKTHTIACSGPQTLTAYFALQHQVTVTTNPVGLMIEVDGILYTTPYVVWWDENTVHSLGAISPQDIIPGSSRYVWVSWSDAGPQYHDITVTGTDTYVASFKLQYKITITSDPPGLEIIADGVPQTTPYVVWLDSGASYSLDVTDPQVVAAGERYVFNSWSDAQPKSHTIVVAMAQTYTAYMDHQFEVTVDSTPVGGITVTVDGMQYTTPQSFWWDDGTSHSIEGIDLQDVGSGVRYAFASWSDLGARAHNIVADMPKTLTATYVTQFEITITTNPGSLDIIVDVVTYTAPQTFWWNDGAPHTIDVITPQPLGIDEQVVFASWSDGGAKSHQIIISAADTITAAFDTEYYLTVQSAFGSTSGEGWYLEGSNAVAGLDSGTVVVGSSRYVFSSWSGDASGTNYAASDLILMDGPKVASTLWTTQHYLTVASVYGDPQGEGWYDDGVTATFSVTTPFHEAGVTDSRHVFQTWAGDSMSTSPSAVIVMNSPKTVEAIWAAQHYLTVTSDHGTPQGEGWYDEGGNAYAVLDSDLHAVSADERFVFASWGGDASGTDYASSNPIAMDQPKTASASWQRQFRLTMESDYGTVSGGGWYDEGQSAFASLDSGLIQIVEGSRAVFDSWGLGASGTDFGQSDPVVMSGPKTARAVWTTQHYLQVNSEYSTVSGGGWFDEGDDTIVSLSEEYVDGPQGTRYAFDQWSGDATGSNFGASNPITMDAPKTANATWRTEHYLTVTSTYGNTSGEGWYPEGSSTVARVESDIARITVGERAVFQQWVGDASGTDYYQSSEILMDAPKTSMALWQREYLVSFESVPTGLFFSLDGNETGAPVALWLESDSTHSLSALEEQKIGGVDYRFESWSDGGAIGHSITASGAMTITLSYTEVSEPSTFDWLPWIGLVILLVVIVLITVLLLAKRRTKDTDESEDGGLEEEDA